ncbi:PepSY domain-containing protein [Aureimonas psammosilenae]|uniref:PepSY domain-containing protein n=1 Tax=Aureimonas psammosilenae TaxID=2495496 RepID=UPI0012613649|nr:hypothetical protein [Aureimonas psammosilenae]
MKIALAGLTGLLAVLSVTVPAAAYDNGFFGAPPAVVVPAQYRDWRDRDSDWDRPRGYDEDRDDRLSERQIARTVMRQGYVRIDDIDLRRDRYIVRAVRPNGALVRLALDAYDGEVLAREQIGWVNDGRRPGRDDRRRPTNGIEFDLGNGGSFGIYSR